MMLEKVSGCALIAIWLLAMASESGAQVDPLQGPGNSLIFVGTNATFTCVSPLGNCVDMTWDEKIVYNIFFFDDFDWNQIHYSIPPNIRDKFIVENSTVGCKLTVTNAQLNDPEEFKCVFRDTQRTAGLYVFNRTEHQLTGLSSRFGYVGSDVTFTCISSIRSCLGMNWYKHKEGTEREIIFNGSTTLYNTDKYSVRSTDPECQLTVKNLESNDAGSIICEIVISQRSFIVTAFLVVFNSRDIPVKRPRSLLNFVGTEATFTCVSPLNGCVEMTWQRGLGRRGFPINYDDYPGFRGKYTLANSTLGCQLTIANVQLTDAAIYQCTFMKTFIGTADLIALNTQHVIPLRRPLEYNFALVGFDTNFVCVSLLGNCILMNWYKHARAPDRFTIYDLENGIYLRDKYVVEKASGGCMLTIKNVEPDDSGSYYCEIVISNRSYEGETEVEVDDLGPLGPLVK